MAPNPKEPSTNWVAIVGVVALAMAAAVSSFWATRDNQSRAEASRAREAAAKAKSAREKAKSWWIELAVTLCQAGTQFGIALMNAKEK